MLSVPRLLLILVALLAVAALASPVPVRVRTPPKDTARRSRSPGRTPPPQSKGISPSQPKGKGPARSAPPGALGPQIIVLNRISYTLEKELGKGQVGKVFAIAGGKLVAKQFKTFQVNQQKSTALKSLYDNEKSNTALVIRSPNAVVSGDSQVNGFGEMFSWIISPRIYGEFFYNTRGLSDHRLKPEGRHDCEKWIVNVVQAEFRRRLIALHASSGLVHLDPHPYNLYWEPSGEKIVGFFDYDEMDVVDGPFYNKKVISLTKETGKTSLTLDELTQHFAKKYYVATDLCNPDIKNGLCLSCRATEMTKGWFRSSDLCESCTSPHNHKHIP